jgi:serine/threonine protein kinase
MIVGIAAVLLFLYMRRKKQRPSSAIEMTDMVLNTYLCKINSTQGTELLTEVEVRELIGGGRFGKIYRGIWQTHTTVALKSISSGNNQNNAELLKEINLLKTLNHPNIVRYYGMYVSGTDSYVVMEFMPEGDVGKYLQKEASRLEFNDLVSM